MKKQEPLFHPMAPLSKLIWLREEKPEIFKQAALFVGIKEYVFHTFFGEYVVDYSIASATGLFNIHTLDWEKEALESAAFHEKNCREWFQQRKFLRI